MADSSSKVAKAAPLVLCGLVLTEAVSAFETTMAYQLMYSNDPFFGTDIAKLTWIVTAYLLVAAAAAGICGRLGDQFGRRRVMIVVLLISAFGSLVSALAPSVEVVIAGRAIQGISGCILPLAIGLARQCLPQRLVTLGISVVGMTALLAGASGAIVGGLTLDYGSWNTIFYIGAGFAVVAAMGSLVLFPSDSERATTGGRVDYVGAVAFAVAISSLLFAVSNLGKWGLLDERTALFGGVGIVVMALWAVWELRAKSPMIELRRFQNAKFTLAMASTAACAIGLFGFTAVLPTAILRTPQSVPLPDGGMLDLPVGLGVSATAAGFIGAIGSVIGFACSPLVARLSQRLGAAYTVMIGCVIGVIGYLSILFTYHSLATFIVSMVVLGAFGTGFAYAGLPTLLAECVPAAETSAATGMQAVVRTAFQGTASAIVGVLLTVGAVTFGQSQFLSESGLRVTVIAGMAAAAVGFVLAYLAYRHKGSYLDDQAPAAVDASGSGVDRPVLANEL